MDDKNSIGGEFGIRFRGGRTVNSDCGFGKTINLISKMSLTVLIAMLSGLAIAEAERFPGVQVQLEQIAGDTAATQNSSVVNTPKLDAAESFETSGEEPVPDQTEIIIPDASSLDVKADDENPRSEVVNQELASLDVVDTGVLKQIQNPQQVSVIPLSSASLEVVDTGISRQVQKPQPVAVEPLDAAEGNESTPGVAADELNTAAAREGSHQAESYKVISPVADAKEKDQIAGTVVTETGNKNVPIEDASGGVVGDETVQPPYAILLVLLALMSMITVSRRNG